MSLYLLICLDSLLIKAEKESFHHNLLKINKGNIMAQLNDTMVNGDLRVTGTIHGNATSATQDGSGNNIVNTYATKDELSEITSGTLPISKGGTGETTAKGIVSNTIQSGLNVGNSDLTDETDIITTHASSGYTSETKDLYRRKATYLWNYIQSKISSVLGLTSTNYGGKAASATSADSSDKVDDCDVDKTGASGGMANVDNLVPSNKIVLNAIQYYLAQFEGNEKEVTFNTVNSSDGELTSKRFVATNYEKLLEVGQGLEINDKSDGTCRIIRMKSLDNPTTMLFKTNSGWQLPVQLTFNTLGQFVAMPQTYQTMPVPEGFGAIGKILTSNGVGTLPTWNDPPSSLKRVNSYTNAIESTATGQTFLQLFKETRSSDTTRLYADVDVCLYGAGYSYDFKLLIAIARNSSGNIAKCRITIIRVTTNSITIRVRIDSSGLMSIVWENAPSYSGLDVRVSINSCISSYWLTPSLEFATSGSNFGSILSSKDYSHYSNSIQTVAFLSDIPDN